MTLSKPTRGRMALCLFLCGTGFVLLAQARPNSKTCIGTVSVEPPNPTSSTLIYARFIGPGDDDGCQFTSVTVSGNTIRVDTSFGCVIGEFFSDRRQLIGVLPPGNYTIEVHDGLSYYDDYLCGSFSVSPAPVPTVSPRFQLALLVTLSVVALAALARTTAPN